MDILKPESNRPIKGWVLIVLIFGVLRTTYHLIERGSSFFGSIGALLLYSGLTLLMMIILVSISWVAFTIFRAGTVIGNPRKEPLLSSSISVWIVRIITVLICVWYFKTIVGAFFSFYVEDAYDNLHGLWSLALQLGGLALLIAAGYVIYTGKKKALGYTWTAVKSLVAGRSTQGAAVPSKLP